MIGKGGKGGTRRRRRLTVKRTLWRGMMWNQSGYAMNDPTNGWGKAHGQRQQGNRVAQLHCVGYVVLLLWYCRSGLLGIFPRCRCVVYDADGR